MRAKKGQSTNYLIVDGIKFYKCASGYYADSKSRRLHVYIWEKHNGKVPDGYDIHHIDHDKSNNDISNLACVLRKSHHSAHIQERDPLQIYYNFYANVQPAADRWHKSVEGREWHKKHYQEVTVPLRANKVSLVCQVCGKEYLADPMVAHKSKYCSNNCRAKARRLSGIDSETRACVMCGKEFVTNKYSRVKTCSKECSNKKMSITKTGVSRHRKTDA